VDKEELLKQSLNAATQLVTLKKLPEAEMLLLRLLDVHGDKVEAHNLLGMVFYAQGKYKDAAGEFAACMALEPDVVDHVNNRLLALAELGEVNEAERLYKEALDIHPHNNLLRNNYALLLRSTGRLEEAIDWMRDLALQYRLDFHYKLNLASTLMEARQMDEAKYWLDKILEDRPFEPVAHVALAHWHFVQKQFAKGWPHYEYRFAYYPQAKAYTDRFPRDKDWFGESPLEGKTVLAYCEQGVGDSIQFARYIPVLKEMGAEVIYHCHPSVHLLMSGLCRVTHVDVETPPPYDYSVSVMSLPLLLDFPETKSPYLAFPVTQGFDPLNYYNPSHKNIGVVWAGNPAHQDDQKRSCHLNEFRSLHDMEGVKLFSFQKELAPRMYKGNKRVFDYAGEGTEGMSLVHLGDQLKSFAETAVLLEHLDGLVTVDTAIAHLAGALGVKTALLLPWNCDWRWGREGDRTCWYPSVTLCRQDAAGDWPSAITKAKRWAEAL